LSFPHSATSILCLLVSKSIRTHPDIPTCLCKMLFTPLAAIFFFSFSFIVRTSHISTSLALILSWTKLSPVPRQTYNLTNPDLSLNRPPFVTEASDRPDLPYHLASHGPSQPMSEATCLNLLGGTMKLVPTTSCSIYDGLGLVQPHLYELFPGFAPLLAKPVKHLEKLYRFLRSKSRPFDGWRPVFTAPLCMILCAIVFIKCRWVSMFWCLSGLVTYFDIE
jgi:hypothetical protein